MTQVSHRSKIEFPESNTLDYNITAIRRDAELQRSLFFVNMVKHAATKTTHMFRSLADLVEFTQRTNSNARL